MEADAGATGDELDVGAGLMEQRCQIEGGRACADHSDGTSLKMVESMVRRAMRYELLRHIGEQRRHVRVVGQADRDDDSSRVTILSTGKLQLEACRRPAEGSHELVFELGDKSLLEFQSILCECLQRNRQTYVGIGETLAFAVRAQSKFQIGIV